MLDFRIKICGVTSPLNATEITAAGVDCIGLNFYQASRRYVTSKVAKSIADKVRGQTKIVGLFVNATQATILKLHDVINFDYVQLHGDEVADTYQFGLMPPVIRAFKWPPKSAIESNFVKSWTVTETGSILAAHLVDANVDSSYGGTGRVTQWSTLVDRPMELRNQSLILAGGLTSHNVAQGIIETKADAVDTAGGVESEPGIKDPEKVRAFVKAAQAAFLKINLENI